MTESDDGQEIKIMELTEDTPREQAISTQVDPATQLMTDHGYTVKPLSNGSYFIPTLGITVRQSRPGR